MGRHSFHPRSTVVELAGSPRESDWSDSLLFHTKEFFCFFTEFLVVCCGINQGLGNKGQILSCPPTSQQDAQVLLSFASTRCDLKWDLKCNCNCSNSPSSFIDEQKELRDPLSGFLEGGPLLNLSGFSQLQKVRYGGRAVSGRMTLTRQLRVTSPYTVFVSSVVVRQFCCGNALRTPVESHQQTDKP